MEITDNYTIDLPENTSNTTRSIVVDFPMQIVNDALGKFLNYSKKYRLIKSNHSLNQYTIGQYRPSTGFLNQGIYININLLSLSEKSTEVELEVNKLTGTLTKTYETKFAEEHIDYLIDTIKELLDYDKSSLRAKKKRKYSVNYSIILLPLGVVFAVILYYLFFL